MCNHPASLINSLFTFLTSSLSLYKRRLMLSMQSLWHVSPTLKGAAEGFDSYGRKSSNSRHLARGCNKSSILASQTTIYSGCLVLCAQYVVGAACSRQLLLQPLITYLWLLYCHNSSFSHMGKENGEVIREFLQL